MSHKNLFTITNQPLFCVYVLECEKGKYYVGSTMKYYLERRFQEHKDGSGSKWTNQFKPIRIIKTIEHLNSKLA